MHFRHHRAPTVSAIALLLSFGSLSACAAQRTHPYPDLHGKTLRELQVELNSGTTNSEALVKRYLERIEAIDRRGPTITDPDRDAAGGLPLWPSGAGIDGADRVEA